jgi:hypothetical protein
MEQIHWVQRVALGAACMALLPVLLMALLPLLLLVPVLVLVLLPVSAISALSGGRG